MRDSANALPPVQTFWTGGRLSTMEQLSIASFAAQGHQVDVYAYEQLDGLPPSARACDAADIIPRRFGRGSAAYRDNRGSYSSFANMFRYKLLLDRGGWWIDLDMVCLRPFDFAAEFIFALEPDRTLGNAVFRVPPGSDVMAYAYNRCVELGRSRKKWGKTGPALLAEAVAACGLTDQVVDHTIFMPVDWPEWKSYLDPNRTWEFEPQTRALHLWNALWAEAGYEKDATYPSRCLYEQLKRRYRVAGQVEAPFDAAGASGRNREP
jgi:Alpha 1,4-glycosyltransferase conserved region